MKAVLLAGGLGTRLRPLTERVPKVMLELEGKPLLYYHIELLKKHEIKDIWICSHYLPEVIEKYFGDGNKFGVSIRYSIEREKLGTSGALKNSDSGIGRDLKGEDFLVVYADNLTDTDYSKLIDLHYKSKSLMTIALYKSDKPWEKGVIEIDEEGKVLNMVEKPPKGQITSDQVNSGIYVCDKTVLDYIPDGPSDFGYDVIPELVRQKRAVHAFNLGSTIHDIGTTQGLEEAREKVKKVKIALNLS